MTISQNKFEELLKLIGKLNHEVEKIKHEDIEVSIKSDDSPITQADLHVNNALNNFIKTTEYQNVISEENKQIDFSQRSKWQWFWIIDPIDGTKEFIKKGDDYTINIALCFKNRPVLSVVSRPSSGDIYYAIKNKGSFLNQKKIQSAFNDGKVKMIASKSHLNKDTELYISKLSKSIKFEIINVGSSLKICFLAEGKAQIYPRFGTTMEWDTAAADLILSEAGGSMLSCVDLEPLMYNKENLKNSYFVCFSDSLNSKEIKEITDLANKNVKN